MLLLSTVSLQFNIAFSSFYKSAEACSVSLCRLPLETVETNENEMKKMKQIHLLNIFIILKLDASERFFQWFKQMKITWS